MNAPNFLIVNAGMIVVKRIQYASHISKESLTIALLNIHKPSSINRRFTSIIPLLTLSPSLRILFCDVYLFLRQKFSRNTNLRLVNTFTFEESLMNIKPPGPSPKATHSTECGCSERHDAAQSQPFCWAARF